MAHNKQIILILFFATLLGFIRFIFLSDSDFTLIKKQKSIEKITSFSIPEIMDSPMSINIDFAKYLFDEKKAVFIDARDEADFKSGHIQDAINIPYDYYEDYEELINDLDITYIYILYCNGTECSLSLDLAELLFNELLFEKILIFEGGWPEWRDAEYPS